MNSHSDEQQTTRRAFVLGATVAAGSLVNSAADADDADYKAYVSARKELDDLKQRFSNLLNNPRAVKPQLRKAMAIGQASIVSLTSCFDEFFTFANDKQKADLTGKAVALYRGLITAMRFDFQDN